ncbi:hypothetical protein OS493_019166 [Desmophyllum pertusum]|uniref:Uncharacterized protein n=1 Tax=Desmophyllum pertusum TaxID=174260 RepID=A0A9W9YBI1_9CNID|nr:hypothetical protein OS493_019166 [Desmophyllum pertusum]
MKNFAQAKRLCASTVFLVSIIVAIVISKETHQKDSLNPVDHVVVNKEPRGWRGVCHSGKCGRRRSGKRGMKLAQAQFENDLQDYEMTSKENFDIQPAEARTIESGKGHRQL